MRRRSRAPALLGVVLLGFACSDDDGGAGPTGPPPPAPVVEATRIFGEAPLEGELTFVSDAPDGTGSAWRFEVDLEADGTIEATGEATGEAAVPYRFDSPGVHPITITLERDGERVVRERPVVVNDPTRIEVLGSVRVDDTPFPGLEGATLDRTRSLLFVSLANERTIAVLDPANMETLNSFRPPELEVENTFEGLGAAPDEDLLYVRTKSRRLGVVELSGTEVEGVVIHPAPGQYFVHPLPGRRAYVGGNALVPPGIAMIDAETGEFLAEGAGIRCRGGHFALSRDESRIAVLDRSTACDTRDNAIVLTDLALVEQQRIEILKSPYTVEWSPSGDKLVVGYFEGGDPSTINDDVCGILVVDTGTGDLLDDIELGSCGQRLGVANPVASTPDGRLAVLPTGAGVFLLDLKIGLPVARVQAPDDLPDECCDVAASPNEDVFYVATLSGYVVKLRIRR